MSILTKISVVILVVLVLLAVPVFITKATVDPSYRQLAEEQKREIQALSQTARMQNAALQVAQRERDDARTATSETAAQKQARIDQLEVENSSLKQTVNQLKNDVTGISGTLAQMKVADEANLARTKELEAKLAAAIAEADKLQKESISLNTLLKQAQADKDNWEQLVRVRDETIHQLEEELERRAAAGATAAAAESPTIAAQVVGTVTAVRGDYASINLGSAKGIKQGMQLVVYRGSEYVAHLRVEEVEVQQAAGVITDRRGAVQQGDKVANKLEK